MKAITGSMGRMWTTATFVVIGMLAILCAGCGDKGTGSGGGGQVDPPKAESDIFVVDISEETDWNYLVVADDGSSMFIEVNESTDIPTRVFLKPDKDSDSGATVFFKENGLPDKVVVDGHILYYGNFTGHKYDLAVIYPDNRIEYHFGVETDVDWDDYIKAAGLSKARGTGDWFKKWILPAALTAVTCGTAFVVKVDVALWGSCGMGVFSYVGSVTLDVIDATCKSCNTEGARLVLDLLDCKSFFSIDWTSMRDVLGAEGAMNACLSIVSRVISDPSNQDYGLTAEKITQINEAVKKIDGDSGTSPVTKPIVPGPATPAKTTFTDGLDGTIYNKVTIGSQVWMAENLNRATDGSKCYDNSPDSCAKYGKLFTWNYAMAACPAGWHLPSGAEWDTLVNYVGGASVAGTKLKSARGWNNNGNGTDDYGFTALPGGAQMNLPGSNGYFLSGGQWWSATENGASYAGKRTISGAYVNAGRSDKTLELLSVRCVLDGEGSITTYTIAFSANGGSGAAPSSQRVNAGNSITLPSGNNLAKNGYTFGGWNTNSYGTGTNYNIGSSYTPTDDITLYAKWNERAGTFFTDSRDGKRYNMVTIGSQVWMAENLNRATADSKCYNDSPDSCVRYGRLYTWDDAKAVCPAGWHLPNDAEWETLETYVGISTAGTKLKSTSGWEDYKGKSGNGTDDYGFSALPGGGGSDGVFESAGVNGSWWSATEKTDPLASMWAIGNSAEIMLGAFNYRTALLSVRCVQN